MLLLIFIIGVISIVSCVYLYYTWNFNYWKKLGIPYEEPLFFFGNCKDALTGKTHLHLIYCNLYKKFPDVPYFGCFKMREPAIVVRDLDIIKDIIVKEFNSFANNDFHVNQEDEPILTGNTFVLTGEEWRVRRAQWSSGLTQTKLKNMFGAMSDKAHETVKYLNKHVNNHPNEPMEVRELAIKYLTDAITSAIFNFDINSFEDPDNSLKVIASNLFAPDYWQGLKQICYTFAPWVHKYIGSGVLSKKVEDQLRDLARQVIRSRTYTGINKNDFFEMLLKEKEVSELDIASLIFGLISEGVETSSTLISYALYELGANPEIQQRLRSEIGKAIAENVGNLTYDLIQSLPYLEQVVQEVLRLHPAVFVFSKVCTKSYELPPLGPGGKPFQIPVGMTVTVPAYATQTDSLYFKDPHVFQPERFSDQNKGDIRKFSFLPFGDGPRICVGMRLGLTNSKICLTHIIRNFEVRVSPLTKTPIQVDPSVVGNRAVGNLWMTFHKVAI